MENKKQYLVWIVGLAILCFGMAVLESCAGQRQGVVCDEIEYRYNSMSYSPDQRAFMEDELRACREEEAKKKGSSGQSQKSIYERFAAQDSVKTVHTAADTLPPQEQKEASVSELLQDSSGAETISIYDRYGQSTPSDSTVVSDSTASAAPSDSTTGEAPQE
jgi:hypothetical protein